MRSLIGLVMAGGLVLGMAGDSKAQFSLSIGNPYGYGTGIGIGNPLGYSYGYPNYSSYGYSGLGLGGYGYNNYYSSGILAGPGGFSYSSGYRGITTPVAPLGGYGYGLGGYGYGYRPYVGSYGYRPYYGGYGYRGGFRPFGGFRRFR